MLLTQRRPGLALAPLTLMCLAGSLAAQSPTVSKEYIRLGDRIVAIEQPSLSFSPVSAAAAAVGSPGSITVTASTSLSWTASTAAAWVHIISGASGTGNGTINYSVDVNTGLLRQGSISITPSGQPAQAFTITQAAGTLSFIPTSASPSGSSTTGSISVTATAGLAWTAAAGSGSTWVSITSGASGTGNGTIGYSIQGNPTWSSRQGTIVITPSGEAAQTFTITQATATFSFTPASASIVVGGGTWSVAVTATSAVNWTAVSNATAWVQITSGASGTGNGTINYSVSANTTASSRQTTITITPSGAAAQAFTITQAGLPTYSLSGTVATGSGVGIFGV